MLRRSLALLVVAAVVFVLVRIDDPHRVEPAPSSPAGLQVVDVAGGATTWFCAAGRGSGNEPPANQVIVTNPGAATTARVTVYPLGAGRPASSVVPIAARSQHAVALPSEGGGLGGVSVEVAAPAVVAHRLVGATRSDQQDCSPATSDRWYFAAADTENNASAILWLLNPSASDASVDIRVATESSVRVPTALRGVIVPARSSKAVDLGQSVQRRAQFSFSVESREGRVAAELAQTVTGRGLRLLPGVAAAVPSWVIADSFGGAGVSEQLQVFNPTPDDVVALVSVFPNGVDAASFPEPFRLEIPRRRFATLDLTAEARVPPDLLRWIRIDTLEGDGVVAAQVVTITAGGGDGTAETRPSVEGGLASSVGSSAAASRWWVSSVDPGPDSRSVIVVANPSTEGISLVSVSNVTSGRKSTIAAKLEVRPQSSLVVDVTEAAATGTLGLEVSASTPVVVSGRTTTVARQDLAMWPAVPLASTVAALPPVEGG